MSALDQLKAALHPLLARTAQRSKRIQQLQAQPPTEQTTKAIAAEQREVELVIGVTQQTEKLVKSLAATAEHSTAVLERVQDVAEEAAHFERLFHVAVTATIDDLPDEQWPDVARRAQLALFRMAHMKSSPSTYAATFGLTA